MMAQSAPVDPFPMSTATQSRPVWPRHHDGKPLSRNEIAQHDPALARRLSPADGLAASLFDLGAALNRVAGAQASPFGLDRSRRV